MQIKDFYDEVIPFVLRKMRLDNSVAQQRELKAICAKLQLFLNKEFNQYDTMEKIQFGKYFGKNLSGIQILNFVLVNHDFETNNITIETDSNADFLIYDRTVF